MLIQQRSVHYMQSARLKPKSSKVFLHHCLVVKRLSRFVGLEVVHVYDQVRSVGVARANVLLNVEVDKLDPHIFELAGFDTSIRDDLTIVVAVILDAECD